MKSKKREVKAATATMTVPPARWPLFAAACAVLVAVWWAYGPALNGPFLFDDAMLPFVRLGASQSLADWLRGVRPVTMLSYWINAQLSGGDPFSYHVLSLIFHLTAGVLVFLIVRRLLEWSNAPEERRPLLAAFGAAIFLLHPAQTEAAAYVAGRSEVVSVMFAYAALAVFLRRRRIEATWGVTAAIYAMFGIAVLAKEHAVALPALLLLTDYWWNPGFSLKGIRGNWRLYAPLPFGVAAVLAMFWGTIFNAGTAGFGMRDFTWYQYLFTQFRALFVYIGVFVLPIRLTADWDFPISLTLFDHGAVFGLLGLLALIALAWRYRRQFPLATYGFFTYLLLMAPTSSILPIKDPLAERRLYFSMLGLILIAIDALTRVKLDKRALAGACAAIALIAAIGTRARAAVWSDPIALWEDTVRKSPNKSRPHLQLASAYYEAQRYQDAIEEFERGAKIDGPTHNLLVDWGLAYDAVNRPDEAIVRLRQAAAMEDTAHVHTQIAMIYAKRQQWDQALAELAAAEKMDPNFSVTYNYRAKIYFQQNRLAEAVENYRRALTLNPSLFDAQSRDELARAETMLRATGGR